jgi:uncharacterized membrane protein
MKIFIKWFLVIAEFVSKFEVRWQGAVQYWKLLLEPARYRRYRYCTLVFGTVTFYSILGKYRTKP